MSVVSHLASTATLNPGESVRLLHVVDRPRDLMRVTASGVGAEVTFLRRRERTTHEGPFEAVLHPDRFVEAFRDDPVTATVTNRGAERLIVSLVSAL